MPLLPVPAFTGKFAWGQKFEQELEQEDVDRGARQAAQYIPTFFTHPQNHAALTAARPQVQQFNQQSIQFGPPQQRAVYYQQYRK